MALVLCTGADRVLLETRKLILEQAGHIVISATDRETVIAACQRWAFDVAVIGQSVSSHNKRVISSVIRWYRPTTKVLELHPTYESKALDDADAWLAVPADVPEELAERVGQLARWPIDA